MLPNEQDQQLKLVIYCPHENIWFKNTVRNVLKRQLLPNKYAPFLDYVLNSKHKLYFTTKLCVDGSLNNYIKAILEPFELLLWCLFNGVNITRVGFIFTRNGLKNKDILILMHYGTFTHEDVNIAKRGEKLAKYLSELKIFKLVHMTHYAYNPTIGSKNLAIFSPDLLVAENNLASHSEFYKKYFSNLTSYFYQLPYVASARFIKNIPFEDRYKKMVVSGSITFKMRDAEFNNFFKIDELQPLRRIIYKNAHKYANQIYSLISDLDASRASNLQKKPSNFFERVIKRLFFYKHPQMSYYKQDIVMAYNSYMMFAVPEEICNLPGIGFIEGMACGCVYFGLDDPMYTSIGMIPGIHYVAYDGTLEDLISKVQYYQRRPEALRLISEKGHSFATQNMCCETVYGNFISYLQRQIRMLP